MKRLWIAAALGVAVLMAACSGGSASAGGASADPTTGRELFVTGGSSQIPCATCHSLDGTELVGPSLQGVAARAGERVEGQSAETYLRQSILQPSTYVVEGYNDVMPKHIGETLSPEEVDNLVAYLMTLE